MDRCRPSASPETRAFVAAVLGKPDPDEVAAFARKLLGEPEPGEHAAFLAAILGESSGEAEPRPRFRPTAHTWSDLATRGSTDDWPITIEVEEARKANDKWESSQTWDTNKNAKILRKSMERDHVHFGPGDEPHHLVQSTDPRAADGRALLNKYHIDVNGAENGLKLDRSIHQTRGLQRGEAIRKVAERLRQAARGARSWEAARDRVMKEMGRIRRDIIAGRFPCP
jgi:hypothetical protein